MSTEELKSTIANIIKEKFNLVFEFEVDRPEEKFGDYATNAALQLAAELHKTPREIAETLAGELRTHDQQIKEITVAGPGFINIHLTDKTLLESLATAASQPLRHKEILVEFGDPNPFKAMHLGHLYTTIIGDAIARLLEQAGADVKRLSYHGDVGLHIAKALWALLKYDGANIAEVMASDTMIGHFYAQGATAYANDFQAKSEIEELNQRIYEYRLGGGDNADQLAQLYEMGYTNSFKAFEAVFTALGVKYSKRYLESESTKAGLQYVNQNIDSVFERSEGAIIYKGEKAGLHTRVFINSRGLPTYEAKDLGLAELKNRDYPKAFESIIITANEQSEYFKVMLAALNEIDPPTAAKTRHVAHGFLSLTTGKMSSREGIGKEQVAANLLAAVREAVARQFPDAIPEAQNAVYLAAVKYSFLKQRIGGDIVFNIEESVSLDGNSGPYLQYAYARACSILHKVGNNAEAGSGQNLEAGERSLARKLTEYSEVLERATTELMPHHVCTYLYELTQTFNRFYEHNRVIGDQRERERVVLVRTYAEVLKSGLNVLGIPAPEQL